MQRKVKKTALKLNGRRFKIGIAVSEFNKDITEKMLQGALSILAKSKVKKENIDIFWVPGAYELPYMCQKIATAGQYNALIALGCIIRGQTEHHRYLSQAVANGLMQVILKHQVPIGFGVITTNNLAQAKARSTGKQNKGSEAAEAVLALLR